MDFAIGEGVMRRELEQNDIKQTLKFSVDLEDDRATFHSMSIDLREAQVSLV